MNIRLFSPSSPCPKNDFEQGLGLLETELGAMCPDLEIMHEGVSCYATAHPQLPYLAGDDRKKALEFQDILNQTDLDFVLCSRGGYGALRWLHMVDWKALRPNVPCLVGFSDVTNLFSAILSSGGRAVHGPMLNTLVKTSREARAALWRFIVNGDLPGLKGRGAGKIGCFEGILSGGNLTCLCHLIGTPFEPEWQDRILFLEDCNEPAYRLDRMFTHLRLAGVFYKIGALALGQFTLPEGRTFSASLFQAILGDRLSGLDIPVVWDLPCGHGTVNMPLQMGRPYRLSSREASLSPL